jgi:hypothetical protein
MDAESDVDLKALEIVQEHFPIFPTACARAITALLREREEEIGRLKASRPVKDGERLLDLVRYSRHALHEEGLITDQEYTELMGVHASPRRLEGYDEVRTKLTAAAAALAKKDEALRRIVAGCRLNAPGSSMLPEIARIAKEALDGK